MKNETHLQCLEAGISYKFCFFYLHYENVHSQFLSCEMTIWISQFKSDIQYLKIFWSKIVV